MSTSTATRKVMSDARTVWSRIPVGAKVLLRFGQRDEVEEAIFLGVTNDPNAPTYRDDNKIATFRSPETGETLVEGAPTYEWAAYRYMGRWAYGSGADTLNVVAHEVDACHFTDAFDGHCDKPVSHKGACAFSGGDTAARVAADTAQRERLTQERVAGWETENAGRALLKQFTDRGIGAGIRITVTVDRVNPDGTTERLVVEQVGSD